MPDSDRISIDNLTLAPDLSNNDVAPVVHTVNGVKSTYKTTMTLLGTFLNKVLQYSADLTTSDKTIIGAINEINAGGGGGGAVILYGTTAPASSLGSDGNLYVQYTAGTGGASDVVDALYAKLDGEWCEISTKQVQSDWSQSDNTKVDYIKNKPSLSTVATSGSYNDLLNKPTIPTNAELLPIQSGSATNTKDYIDSKCVTITTGTFTASSNVNVLRSTLIKIGNLKILSVIFSRTGDTNTLGTVSSGFEALYNYDFIATKDYGEGVRMRINQSNSIGFSTTPNANDYYAFTLTYV